MPKTATVDDAVSWLRELTLSYGCVQSLLAAGIKPDELELETFRAEAQRWLGDELRPWLWSYQVCIGIK